MRLPEISHKLRKIAALDMAAQSYQTLILDLAVELDLEEARLSKERARKLHGPSKDNPRKLRGDGAEIPASRVIDNTKPFLTSGEESKKESPPSPSKPLSSDPEGFKEFWAIYPPRAGDRDRKPATKAFSAALKRVDLKTLLWATERYAADCKAKGKINTEFVKQARTWLNADGWTEYQQTDARADMGIPITKKVPVFDDSEAWQAWKKLKPGLIARDIRCDDGRIRHGWYFPSEFPPAQSEQAA